MAFGVFDIVKDAVKGELEYAPPTLQENRINICNSCEHLGKLRQCKVCGCFVDAKVKFLKSECPIKKW